MQVIAAVDLSVSSGRVRFGRAAMASDRCKRSAAMKAAATLPLAPLISEPLALSLYERDVYQAIHAGNPWKAACFRWTAIRAPGPSPLS